MWFATAFPAIAVMVGLGHSLLAMSGFETLAQVNREIAHPKQKNLQKAGMVIFLYSLTFTSLVSFFAVMLIPDAERALFLDNLIGGLSMHLAGPVALRLLFHAFVVFVGALILAGAVNTAIYRIERRAEPDRRRRCSAGLPAPAPRALRHHLPDDQHGGGAAADHRVC